MDPVTKKETKGKERMVYDYRILNENTHKDQYSLPGINTIIQRIGNAKVFSKFDLKAGFHQVAMDEKSIPWTAFLVPGGLYEWLVMPFGLKNAPAIFQRKMDNCFAGSEAFIAVYIDDILVFSQNIESHAQHLIKMLHICKQHGLVLSPTKMKIATTEVDFLGVTIGNRRIKLQPHIIKKIADVPEQELRTTKGLRSWLGVLNYARSYIPKCGTILGPLYSKVGPHGDSRWNDEDWRCVQKVKHLIRNLPDLELPPPGAYMVIETDGCMDGWGGVCKWKPGRGSSKSEERVCAYVSGKFPVPKSTIRTDCQAIIAFHDKQSQNKPSRVRWLNFCDFITSTGINMRFEHIKGDHNQLADKLSRLAHSLYTLQSQNQEWNPPTDQQDQIHLLVSALSEIQDLVEEEVLLSPETVPHLQDLLVQLLKDLPLLGETETQTPSSSLTLTKQHGRTARPYHSRPTWRNAPHTVLLLMQPRPERSPSWVTSLQRWKASSERNWRVVMLTPPTTTITGTTYQRTSTDRLSSTSSSKTSRSCSSMTTTCESPPPVEEI